MRRSSADGYLAALEAEIDRAHETARGAAFPATTLFLGGGTPNTYEPAAIAALVGRLRDRYAPAGFAETTIELNPDAALCSSDAFSAYAAAGIDRLSFGVQSFVPAELATLGRRHTPQDVAAAFGRARAAGLANLSLDLMFGTPGQTAESWKASLEAALALEPDHVSTYGLTIEEGTPFAGWFARSPADFAANDLEAELYGIAIDRLAVAGFEHYEISNFARPGARSRHNAVYWANGDYLGFGVGAASYRDGVRSVHTRDLGAYVAAARAGGEIPGEAERLTGAARTGEAVMLGLRTAEGVDIAAFAQRYGVDVCEFYRPVLDEMHAAETLDVTATHVRLTRRGRFVANDVCAAFVNFAP
jgi:oxygen-independent coproporphyrinogen-3 oxidase